MTIHLMQRQNIEEMVAMLTQKANKASNELWLKIKNVGS